MKKVTKIVTLAAAAMCAFAVVGGSFAVAGAANRAYAAANATHNIAYRADSAITVKGPEVAKSGSKVEIELTYNHRLYEVLSVRVGDDFAAQNNDNGKTFYFVMPNDDVEVVVNSRYLGEDESIHAISNGNAARGIYLNGCPANARANDLISFTVAVAADAPYRFAGSVSVYTDDEDERSISCNFDGEYYNFVMPDAPVVIGALVEAKSYFLNFNEPTLVNTVKFKDSLSYVDAERQVYDNDGDGYFIPYDADVTVSFRNTNLVLVDGVKLGDQELTFDNNLVIKFKMPGKDLDLEILTEVFYRPIVVDYDGVIDELRGVTTDYTSHYDFKFYRSATSSGTYEEFDPTQVVYGDYVRMYVTPKEGFEDRKASSMLVVYIDQNGMPYSGNYLNSVSTTKGTDANGEYYQWYVTASHYSYLVNVPAEAVMQFMGYEFVGTYRYYNVYSNGGSSVTTTNESTIDEYGVITHKTSYSSSTVNISKNGDATVKTGSGTVIVGTTGGLGFYGGGWFIRSYSANTGANKTYDNYVLFKSNSSSLKFNYQLYRNQFCAIEATLNGEVLGRCFYTLVSVGSTYGIDKFYGVGVTFEFNNGTGVNNSSSYTVKVNGEVLGSVSGSGSSGRFTAA